MTMTEEGGPGPAQGIEKKKPCCDKEEVYRLFQEISCKIAG